MKCYVKLNIKTCVQAENCTLIICDDESYEKLLKAELIVDEETEFVDKMRPVVFLGDSVQAQNDDKLKAFIDAKEALFAQEEFIVDAKEE